MSRARASWGILLWVACATPRHELPPGDALEHPEPPPSTSEVESPPPPPAPLSPDSSLLDLFEPDTNANTSTNANASARQSVPTENVAASPPSPGLAGDEARAAAEHFRARAKALEARLRRRDAAGASNELKQLSELASRLGPDEALSVAELRFLAASTSGDEQGATSAAEAWLKACGPARVDVCRRRALSALGRAAQSAKRKAAVKRQLASIRAADSCVQRLEKTKGRPHRCVDASLTLYRRMRDKLMSARLLLAQTQAAKTPKERLAKLSRVEAECTEARCSSVRRAALRQRASIHLAEGELGDAAKSALLELALSAAERPPHERVYVRTLEVDRLCARLDAQQGAGTCRQLERKLCGTYFFIDYSRNKRPQAGLSPDDVRRVGEHYNVLLQECLGAQARRLVPPAVETYQLRWMVTHEGRVDQLKLSPPEHENGPFAECLRSQFALWRYPRYRGEHQHVEQSFTLTSRATGARADGSSARF